MAFNCISCKSEIDPSSKACPRCGDQISDFLRTYQQELLDGKYELQERLGRGGMGEVYKVRHTHLHTTRVVKVMRPQLTGDQSLHERFVREAKLATRIQHQNVATLHDFSSLPDGSYYMIWEYIDGLNLAALIRRDGRLGIRTVIDISIQTLQGLEAVHAAGIVHRDISPENIMVSTDSSGQLKVKLIDLGIAKSDAVDNSQTATGMFVGKWKYASPEHLGMMEPGEVIDGRADLYSFGIVLYEMLAGRPPFEATTPGQYLVVHSRETANPLVDRPISFPDAPGLENVLHRALEKKRELRFANARDFARALGEVLSRMQGVHDVPTTITSMPSYQGPTAPGSGPALPTMMQTTPTPAPAPLQGQQGSPGAFDPTMAVPAPGAHAPTMFVPSPGAHSPTVSIQSPQSQGMGVPPPPPAGYQTTPGAQQYYQTTPGASQTVLTSPGAQPPKKSNSAIFAVLGAIGALVLLLAAAGGWFLYRQMKEEPPQQTASVTESNATDTTTAAPSGTTLEVAVTPATSTTATTPATETTATLVEIAPTTTTAPVIPPVTTTQPPRVTPPPIKPPPPTQTSEPATTTPEETAPAGDDTIASSGPFGRRSRNLAKDETYSRGFKRGIIRDYSDMWAGTDVDWASVARGVKLSQYAIKVGPFRNLTRFNSPGLRRVLETQLQEEFDGIAGPKGTLITQNAIIWASDAEDGEKGLGIEMIFRDRSGRVVAKLRNFVKDYPPEEAAEEMLEQLTDFVEDHPVIK